MPRALNDFLSTAVTPKIVVGCGWKWADFQSGEGHDPVAAHPPHRFYTIDPTARVEPDMVSTWEDADLTPAKGKIWEVRFEAVCTSCIKNMPNLVKLDLITLGDGDIPDDLPPWSWKTAVAKANGVIRRDGKIVVIAGREGVDAAVKEMKYLGLSIRMYGDDLIEGQYKKKAIGNTTYLKATGSRARVVQDNVINNDDGNYVGCTVFDTNNCTLF